MNFLDFLIIYLTCGAPLGVFYFLQKRREQKGFRLWLETFFTFIVWLPFGWQLALESKAGKNFRAANTLFAGTNRADAEILLYQKQFEELLAKCRLPISIFEFREVFERYVGLTIAGEDANSKKTATEFFQIVNPGSVEMGAICLNRRNLKRLAFHQTQARKDFFQIVGQLTTEIPDSHKFLRLAADFFQLFDDAEARFLIEQMSFEKPRNKRDFALTYSENYLWNTETIKSPPAQPIAFRRQTPNTRTNSSAKD